MESKGFISSGKATLFLCISIVLLESIFNIPISVVRDNMISNIDMLSQELILILTALCNMIAGIIAILVSIKLVFDKRKITKESFKLIVLNFITIFIILSFISIIYTFIEFIINISPNEMALNPNQYESLVQSSELIDSAELVQNTDSEIEKSFKLLGLGAGLDIIAIIVYVIIIRNKLKTYISEENVI